MCAETPAGEAAARNGALLRRRALRFLHEGIEYVERGQATTPQPARRRVQKLKRELRLLGYSDDLKPIQAGALA